MSRDVEPGAAPSPEDRCPVTGLPIERRPEWTGVELAPGYTVSVEVIGRHIVHSMPLGHATGDGVAAVNELHERVIAEAVPAGRPHVHVSDYSHLGGATANARRIFLAGLQRRRGIAAFVVYGASPLLSLSTKLGARFKIIPIEVEIAADYGDAMRLAVDVLQKRGVAIGGLRPNPPPVEPGAAPESGVFELDGYSLAYEIIDGHIVLGRSTGYLGLREMERHLEVERMIVASIDRSYGPPVMVADLSGLEGISGNARRLCVAALRARHRTNPVALYVCFGVNPALRHAINVSRPFLPFRIRVAAGREAALVMARRESTSVSRTTVDRIRRALSLGPRPPARTTSSEIDDVLRVIAKIDWEVEGPIAEASQLAPNHPAAPVVEGLQLIKADMDELFRVRRRTEAALRESEERYRTIVETIVDGYYEIDLDGRLLFLNDALLQIFGYQRSDVDDVDPKDLMDEDNLEVAIETFRTVYETRRPARVTAWEMVRRDGAPIQVEVSISLVTDHEDRPVGFRGIIRDITERTRAEQERVSLEAQLQRSQRMEAIGTLAGGIAHNFNNLLMGIQGNVSLLAQELGGDSPLAKRLRTIEALVDGGSKLTSQLLGYARSGRVDVRVVDLNRLVLDTAETFSLTRREYRIHDELCDQALPVEVDPSQIEQALLNLLINAADAMPRGGDVTLTSCLREATQIEVAELELRPGSYAEVTIQDTGCGMDPATLERIFEPFFTTKGLTGGTGLGLASAYGIIRAHGGQIEVESALGEGSSFCLLLPAVAGRPVAESAERMQPLKGEGTVLVVDDDPAVLEACASMLTLLDYTPICAGSGEAAVDIFSRRCDDIDLVVLDLILTDLSGAEVFARIRVVDPSVRVLLASGYSLDGEAASMLERGCNDFIQKPFTMEQLSRKLEELLHHA
ncbi:MAG TPA: PAS domain S-box protein [Methylomirabilota bacterium]|nr:PAS domain S-box protein [Methylomirabilota bacterium]